MAVAFHDQLFHIVAQELKQILSSDSQKSQPVIQAVSMTLWQNLRQWVQRIQGTPESFIIALTGASGSGKSFIREALVEKLSQLSEVSSFTQDNYYRDFEIDFPHIALEQFYDEINLDDPTHLRFEQLQLDLQRIKNASYGDWLAIPKLRYGTPTTKPTILHKGLFVEVAPFMVTEGIHAFYDPRTLPLYDFKIYVDIDEATRRDRWLERNRLENRGTTDNMWNTTVDCLVRYTLPTRANADLVINNNVPAHQVNQLIEDVVALFATATEKIRKSAA